MQRIRNLILDIETYSSVDLKTHGVYRYAEAPDFEILLISYSADFGSVEQIDLKSGGSIPREIVQAIKDNGVIKYAHNAQFERVCLSRMLCDCGEYLNPASWRCSRVMCSYLGIPASLEDATRWLGLSELKMSEGKKLVTKFCTPKRGGKNTNMRTLPADDPQGWKAFCEYNRQDVKATVELIQFLSGYDIPDHIWNEYREDQLINDRGIRVDIGLTEAAIAMDEKEKELTSERLKTLTRVTNPASVQQMKQWLANQGVQTNSLDKKAVKKLIKAYPEYEEILNLWQKLKKTSVSKYQAMMDYVCADLRARGMFRFLGAGKTGRFTSVGIQLQNLPQNHILNIDVAKKLVEKKDSSAIELLYDAIPDTLSELVRTAFIPGEGYSFAVADYSQIEARVLAYLAGEKWRIELFNTEGADLYSATASRMFGVPVEKHGVNSNLRTKGKIAELALGYGGAEGALQQMGALENGITEEELPDIVESWRQTNRKIVALWKDIEMAVKNAIKGYPTRVRGLSITSKYEMLMITLPSGRKLCYPVPRIEINKKGFESITFLGVDSITHKWERIETYGAKLCENITQAIARDILCDALLRLKNYRVCAHVHDEVIVEVSNPDDLKKICELMEQSPSWMPDLRLAVDGFVTDFYRKE